MICVCGMLSQIGGSLFPARKLLRFNMDNDNQEFSAYMQHVQGRCGCAILVAVDAIRHHGSSVTCILLCFINYNYVEN